MSIRPILVIPDPVLKQVSTPVGSITAEVRALAADMLETMYDAPGIGLAAIQIGVPKRLITIDLGRSDDERSPIVLINPEVIWESVERNVYEEGCLSIPDYYEEVERPSAVKVSYMDLEGKQQQMDADGLLATCVQHEIDHLNGVLFIDHLSRLKRERVVKKFAKVARERLR